RRLGLHFCRCCRPAALHPARRDAGAAGDRYEAGGGGLREAAHDLQSRNIGAGGNNFRRWRQWNSGVLEDGARLHQPPSQPSMFDVKTMKLIKTIEVPQGFSSDGIYCDNFNDRVYIGSHPTKSLMVVDAKDGSVVGNVDLGGTPEQTVADVKGKVYQVLQDRPGGVAVIEAKTLKITGEEPVG